MVDASQTLISLLPGLATLGDEAVFDQAISDLHQDSRTVTPGSLFIAMPGTQTHGDRYIEAAINAGAVAVVKSAERFTLT